MYLALKDFVRGVRWLKRFGYSGQSDFGEGREGWDLLKRLEVEVLDRGIRDDEDDNDSGIDGMRIGDEGGEEEESEEEDQQEHEIDDLLAITGFIDFF